MSETVLDTRDLSMRFGGVQAVNNVNFSLQRARAALPDRAQRRRQEHRSSSASPARSASTTRHGRVFIRGHDVTGWRAYEIVRLGVGIKTQVPSVMNGLNVEENLWLSARRVNGREPAPRRWPR